MPFHRPPQTPAEPPERPHPRQTPLARIFAEGFRVFFLAATLWAALAAALWAFWLMRGLAPFLPAAAPPAQWHAHEMIFGYGGAVLAGIFLTSPSRGARRVYFPLLAALWLSGRVALACSAHLPAPLVAALDLSFGVPVLARLAPPLFRRFKPQGAVFLAIFAAHWGADLAMHLDWMGLAPGLAPKGALAGLLACAVMNASFGGRLTAAFTRNAMMQAGGQAGTPPDATALPQDSALLNALGPGLIALGLLCLAAPALTGAALTGAVLLAAGGVNLARLARWRGLWAARHSALLAGFHLGFLCLGLGLAAMGLSLLAHGTLASGATHLLALGAVAGLSMAVMAKGALGQTGRPAEAGGLMRAAGAALACATLTRALASEPFGLVASALLFSAAYGLFFTAVLPALAGAKLRAGSPGARPLHSHHRPASLHETGRPEPGQP